MSIELAVLGSGSSGNATLVRFTCNGRAHLALIDAGLSPRETKKRLAPFGISPAEIEFILLTHLDRDHFHIGWGRACERWGIPVHAHRRHARLLVEWQAAGPRRFEPFDSSLTLCGCVHVEAVFLAHDELGTIGFVIEHEGVRLGFATDLGRVPATLFKHFVNLDLLALESNYDRSMQIESRRPMSLKARIMGGRGHLSNEQSFAAVQRIAAQSRLRHIVLLHLSRQCNRPEIVASLYEASAPHLGRLMTITSQFRATAMLSVADRQAWIAPQHQPLLPYCTSAAPDAPLQAAGNLVPAMTSG